MVDTQGISQVTTSITGHGIISPRTQCLCECSIALAPFPLILHLFVRSPPDVDLAAHHHRLRVRDRCRHTLANPRACRTSFRRHLEYIAFHLSFRIRHDITHLHYGTGPSPVLSCYIHSECTALLACYRGPMWFPPAAIAPFQTATWYPHFQLRTTE